MRGAKQPISVLEQVVVGRVFLIFAVPHRLVEISKEVFLAGRSVCTEAAVASVNGRPDRRLGHVSSARGTAATVVFKVKKSSKVAKYAK